MEGGENLHSFVPNARRWVDVFGLYAYYELYKNGILLYRGITKLSVIEKIKKHARDCKRFDDNRYIEDVKNRLKPDIYTGDFHEI